MQHQTVHLDGREYVIVPRDDYDRMAGRAAVRTELPPLPQADAHGHRPAVQQDRAESIDPRSHFFADDRSRRPTDHIGEAGVSFISRVSLNMDVVAQRIARPVHKFDHAEAFVHGLKQAPIASLSLSERHEARARFVLALSAPESRTGQADKRRGVKRPL